ncbi:MAG: thioester domain-containing protein [Actinocatenispora sp.]
MVAAAVGALVLSGTSGAFARGDAAKPPMSTRSAPDAADGGAAIGRGDRIAWLADNQPGGAAPVVIFSLTFSDGNSRTAYCIDFNHNADRTGSTYDPGQWDGSNVKNLPKIQWILTNSFPHQSATAVLKAAGVTDTSGLSDTAFVAYVGTQTAIWHYSDGVEITGNSDRHSGPSDRPLSDTEYAAVSKVREYLISKAGDAPEPPAPAVTIDPATASGPAGSPVGPFTISTSGVVSDLALSATGDAAPVDKDGRPVTKLGNGSKFWLKSDTTGQVTVTAQGAGTIPTGQVYMAKNGHHSFQKLILADTASRKVSASAAVTVAAASPSPSPSSAAPSTSPVGASPSSTQAGGGLPVTGTSLPIIIGVAVLLLVGGGAIVVLARRRRATNL